MIQSNHSIYCSNFINHFEYYNQKFQMSGEPDFEQKAQKLFNRLNAVSIPPKVFKKGPQPNFKPISSQQLVKIKEEIDTTEIQTRHKMKTLTQNLRKLEGTLTEESSNRSKMQDNFNVTVAKMEKNMKNVLNAVQKSFSEKQKKLEQKIESLIKIQKKQIEQRLQDNEELIDNILKLQTKITAIVQEVSFLRKTRLQLQEKVIKQFNDQLRQLKRIFQNDVHQRQQRETKSIASLKNLYKSAIQKIYEQVNLRQQNQKMLMVVVEQLVNHVIQA